MLPCPQTIVDVGGGAAPYPNATEILDLLDHDFVQRLSYDADYLRVAGQRWTTLDICSRQPWPYGDTHFDFNVCSHTLEDVKDQLSGYVMNWRVCLGLDTSNSHPVFKRAFVAWSGAVSQGGGHIIAG